MTAKFAECIPLVVFGFARSGEAEEVVNARDVAGIHPALGEKLGIGRHRTGHVLEEGDEVPIEPFSRVTPQELVERGLVKAAQGPRRPVGLRRDLELRDVEFPASSLFRHSSWRTAYRFLTEID